MKQIVDLKEGMTAKVEGGKLVIEMPKKYTPKKGDFVTCDRNTHGNKWIMIWNGIDGRTTNEFCGYCVNQKRLDMDGNSCLRNEFFRPSTKEERKILISALAEKGKRWDAEKMQIVDINKKWKPKAGDVVTTVSPRGKTISIYKSGNVSVGCVWDFYASMHYANGFRVEEQMMDCFGDGKIRLSTYDERCTFFARLVAEGYKWNAKKLRLTKVGKWVPKDGDFVAHTDKYGDTLISIFKESRPDGTVATHAGVGDGPWRGLLIDDWSLAEWADRPATESEIKIMNDALAKAGRRWNAAAKRIERWRAEPGDIYEYVDLFDGKIDTVQKAEMSTPLDDSRFNLGNYFKPGSGDIEKAADNINEIFKSNL